MPEGDYGGWSDQDNWDNAMTGYLQTIQDATGLSQEQLLAMSNEEFDALLQEYQLGEYDPAAATNEAIEGQTGGKWGPFYQAFAGGGGGITPELIAAWNNMGGDLTEAADLMSLGTGAMGMRQQARQEEMQPLRMQLINSMVGDLGSPAMNPYASMPTALPNLPGIEGGGATGSTPTGDRPGLTQTNPFSDLRSQLAGSFGGDGGGTPPIGGGGEPPIPPVGGGMEPPIAPPIGGGMEPPVQPPIEPPTGPIRPPDDDRGDDPCRGLTGDALARCRESQGGRIP